MDSTSSIGDFSYKTCNTFDSFNRLIFLNVYILIMGFFFYFIPTTCITTFLYLVSWIFCFMNGCLWCISFIKIWWHLLSHNRRSIFDILIDPYPNARPKNTPQVLWVRGKCYSNFISEKIHGSGKKDKYNPWYLKYKVLNENWISRTEAFDKMAKHIVELSSQIFGRSPHFIMAIFSVNYFIIFSCSMIYFISRILGYKLGLVRIPKYPDHCPRRWYHGKNDRRGYRYKNNLKKETMPK